jgi:hypothetical protein
MEIKISVFVWNVFRIIVPTMGILRVFPAANDKDGKQQKGKPGRHGNIVSVIQKTPIGYFSIKATERTPKLSSGIFILNE